MEASKHINNLTCFTMLYFEVITCSLSYKRLRFISEVNALSGSNVILFEDKSLKNKEK